MDRFIQAIASSLPRRRPDARDAELAVQVIVEREGSSENRHCGLLFGDSDLMGCWWGYSPAARVRIHVPEIVLREENAGAATGTSLVMSGRVRLRGEIADLATLCRYTRAPRFRSYMMRLAATPGPRFAGQIGADHPDRRDDHAGERDREFPGDRRKAPRPGSPCEAVVVLAAPNDADGVLSPMAKDRTRAALDMVRAQPASRLVLTGGFGGQFNTTGQPHWRHCAAWLAEQETSPGTILACLETRHTYDDVLFLAELSRRHRFTGMRLVTSDYHAARVRFILDLVLPGAEVVGVRHEGLPAEQSAALREHELQALAKTISSTLLFGPDRLLEPLIRARNGRYEVWRPAARTVGR